MIPDAIIWFQGKFYRTYGFTSGRKTKTRVLVEQTKSTDGSLDLGVTLTINNRVVGTGLGIQKIVRNGHNHIVLSKGKV